MEQNEGAASKARAIDRALARSLLQRDQPFAQIGMGERVDLADMADDLRIRRGLESCLSEVDQPGQGLPDLLMRRLAGNCDGVNDIPAAAIADGEAVE